MASHRTSSVAGSGIYEAPPVPTTARPYGSKPSSVVGSPGPYSSKPPSVVGSPGPYSSKPSSVVGSPGPYGTKANSVVGSPDPFASFAAGSTAPRTDYGGASMLGSGFPRMGYDASIMESSPPKKQAKEYPPKTIRIIGIIFIVIGVLCIAFNITTIVLDSYFAKLAAGIWGGIVVSVTSGARRIV